MKRTIFILLLLTGFCIWNTEAQQFVTQEQCQQADAQLNQVYQQLRGALNNAQKEELKQEQRAWIKERDTLIRDNPNNPGGAFKYATEKRTKYLKNKGSSLNRVG